MSEEQGSNINAFSYGLPKFFWFILAFCTSSFRECSRSSLCHPFSHWSNLVFVIDSITGPDLLFIIDSLTVADVPFLIKDNQDEKRERKSKRNGNETNSSNRIELDQKVTDGHRRSKKVEEP
jgi:hypothetical protein